MDQWFEDLSPAEIREEIYWEEGDVRYHTLKDLLVETMEVQPVKTNLFKNLTIHPSISHSNEDGIISNEDGIIIRRVDGERFYGGWHGRRPLTNASKNRLGRLLDKHMVSWHTTYTDYFMAVSYNLR